MAEENLPTPVEELEKATKADEAELNKMPQSEEDPANEELEEESPASDDSEGETESPEPDGEKETEEQPAVEEEKQVPESQTEEEKPPNDLSSRGQERFKVLTDKLKAQTSENEQLKVLVQTLQGQGLNPQQAQQIAQQTVDPGADQQQVAILAQTAARQMVQEERAVEQQRQKTENFNDDLKIVESEHDELNEDSPEYDQNLSNFVAEVYENRVAKDPKARLTDVAKEVLAIRDRQVKEAVAKKETELRKKVASQAMPASGGGTKGDTLSDQLKNAETEADLVKIRQQLPVSD